MSIRKKNFDTETSENLFPEIFETPRTDTHNRFYGKEKHILEKNADNNALER